MEHKHYRNHVFYGGNMKKVVLFLRDLRERGAAGERVEAETAEGYLLVALLLRSHPMAAAIGAGDAVSERMVRRNVLPDPLGKREHEYIL